MFFLQPFSASTTMMICSILEKLLVQCRKVIITRESFPWTTPKMFDDGQSNSDEYA